MLRNNHDLDNIQYLEDDYDRLEQHREERRQAAQEGQIQTLLDQRQDVLNKKTERSESIVLDIPVRGEPSSISLNITINFVNDRKPN